MPTAVSDDGLPTSTVAVVIVPIDESFVASRTTIQRGGTDIDFACFCAIQVPDEDLAVVAARINVTTIRGARWGEVATD